ncbi:MAG: hypothetical protein M1820_004377 [Bogoriella megaspora]|nr:MAG: hypothetical protein M1820_004377 [Bogoriella megaspora]
MFRSAFDAARTSLNLKNSEHLLWLCEGSHPLSSFQKAVDIASTDSIISFAIEDQEMLANSASKDKTSALRSDRDVAYHLIAQGRINYDRKTIATRRARLRKALAEREDHAPNFRLQLCHIELLNHFLHSRGGIIVDKTYGVGGSGILPRASSTTPYSKLPPSTVPHPSPHPLLSFLGRNKR